MPTEKMASIVLRCYKKSLLEPLSESKALGEDFFHYFLRSGRWGARVDQHGHSCRNVPGFLSFLGNEDYSLLRNLSSIAGVNEQT